MLRRKADQLTQVLVIDLGHHRRHQRHADPGTAADFDGTGLFLQKRAATQLSVNVIPGSVELQEDNIQARLCQCLHVSRILSETDSVGIDLHITAAGAFRFPHQLRKIFPHRRLSAGELQKRAAASRGNVPDLFFYMVRRRIRGGILRIRKAVPAVQIAAVCHLQQHTTAAALMLRAQTAVSRAGKTLLPGKRLASQAPPGKI